MKFVKDIVTSTADKLTRRRRQRHEVSCGHHDRDPESRSAGRRDRQGSRVLQLRHQRPDQMTFGFSRDDAGKFLDAYYENKIYENDPFARLDQNGVGKLIKMAAEGGRKTRPDIKLGICGEHGGDPTSVEFCHNIGLNYVSCSPFRVPIARLAAAQAAIKEKNAK